MACVLHARISAVPGSAGRTNRFSHTLCARDPTRFPANADTLTLCSGFESLRSLDMSFCQVHDNVLPPLRQLTTLVSLGVHIHVLLLVEWADGWGLLAADLS